MGSVETHICDRDLILYADAELDAQKAAALRSHLEVCSRCSARFTELQGGIDSYFSAYRAVLDQRLPSVEGRSSELVVLMKRRKPVPPQKFNWQRVALAIAASLVLTLAYSGKGSELAVPKSRLTPGEARTTVPEDVCRSAEASNRPAPVSLRARVFLEYGISEARTNAYEVDYLITPALGGADSLRNLWPQPYSSVWNAHVKDALEDRLRDLVCGGQLELVTAQREISGNWIGAYKKYFRTDRPLPPRS